ncbi:enoyl-CoA hydratase/isomerase family protein [Rhodococcus sp. GB-02]
MPYLDRAGEVFVLHLGNEGEPDTPNPFNPRWLDQVEDLLTEVENFDGPGALVTTAVGKFYSTGLDTDWILHNADQVNGYIDRVQTLFARMLTFAMPTVAALPGHAFGGGAILAAAHDHVVMREDRGFFCLPGITIGASYAPGSIALLASRLPTRAVHDALVTGRRYGGIEALSAGFVDQVAAPDDVLSTAVDYARTLTRTRGRTLNEIKELLYAEPLALLRTPVVGIDKQVILKDN